MVLCKKFATKCCVYLPKIANCLNCRKRYIQVSISQSRYFSFQLHQGIIRVEDRSVMFQSRNRDTFLFNCNLKSRPRIHQYSFNLAIEILFFSTGNPINHDSICHCFNLAIEILFFSTAIYWNSDDTCRRGCYFCERCFLT